MKLIELYDIEVVPGDEIKKDSHVHSIGSGAFSKVHKSRSDPHMVNKVGRGINQEDPAYSSDVDGYWTFVNFVHKNELYKHNPHFPRIYKVNYSTYQAQMEKLFSFYDLDEKILTAYHDMVLGESDSNELISDRDTLLITELARAISTGQSSHIKLKSLLKAAQYLHQLLVENENLGLDLHRANVMYRRTSKGIDLVFTDPFF